MMTKQAKSHAEKGVGALKQCGLCGKKKISQKPIAVGSGFVMMKTLTCYFHTLGIAAPATIDVLHCAPIIMLRDIQEIGKLVQPVKMILEQRCTFIMARTNTISRS
jgi:hypothetical protein